MYRDECTIVGSPGDPHVVEVEGVIRGLGRLVRVLDVMSLEDQPESWGPDIPADAESRGWIRRLAPPTWRLGVVSHSHDAAIRGAWMTRLTGMLLASDRRWLTDLPVLLRAESKMFQLQRARHLGIRIPRTVVSTQLTDALALGPRVVVKPLGPASFVEDGETMVVPAQVMEVAALAQADASAAPFMYQEVVVARAHLRVVTVQESAWVARLDADGLPLDWRTVDSAHASFRSVPGGVEEVSSQALTLAGSCGVGFSSQDWIEEPDGSLTFLDLNPSGQWLFLPTETSGPATQAIGHFLVNMKYPVNMRRGDRENA